jgi:hypothetical protein
MTTMRFAANRPASANQAEAFCSCANFNRIVIVDIAIAVSILICAMILVSVLGVLITLVSLLILAEAGRVHPIHTKQRKRL